MVRRGPRRTAGHGLHLRPEAIEEMRSRLPQVAEETVAAIIAEVPSYRGALSGVMGENIRNAVQLALGGFISLAARRRGADAGTPAAPATEGAYQLGRGEARSGRSVDALLAAYRIGARVSWREMSATAVRNGVDADTLASFAELVFAYIDELSAASVAGHTDELATTGRVRQRLLERLVHHLLTGATPQVVQAAAERAGWEPPTTLTAVVVPESQVRPVLGGLAGGTLQAAEDLPGLDDRVLLLVPDAGGRARGALLRTIEGRGAVAGPARPWLQVPLVGRPGAARAAAPGSAPTPSSTWPGWCSPRTPRRWPTCAPGPWPRSRGCGRRPPRSWPRPCARGCSTRGAATTWRPPCSCTRRRCATGWASCATCTATGSRTPPSCST